MSQKSKPAEFTESISATFRLLALCAQARPNTAQSKQIFDRAERVSDWDALPAYAEVHGLAPLAAHHLTAIEFPIPRSAKRELRALAARHRLASETRTRILRDILTRYESAGIRVMLLKGAALAHLIYPEPSLRPMRDIDLLVRKADALNAQKILGELGFDAPLSDEKDFAHRHLTAATKMVDGFLVSVEVHHNLFEAGSSPRLMELDEVANSLQFSVGDVPAQTLGAEDMLWYLCQHLVESTNVFSCVGLIWVADAVNFAEQFAAEINWERVKKKYPLVPSTLSLLHWLTPLSDELIARAGIAIGHEPCGIWQDFRKAPRTTPEEQFAHGYAHAFREGFFPSEWWLRIHFGVGSAQPLRGWHRLQHLQYLAARYTHVLKRQHQK